MMVPILLLTYNRPDFLRKRLFELLEMEKVNLVIVSIDYCSDRLKAENKSVINDFLNLHKENLRVIQRDSNLGIAHHLPQAVSEVLSEFSHVIVIEDDIRIGRGSISHFVSASKLLDSRPEIFTIGGFGPTFWTLSRIRQNKWRESLYFSAWGWMTSKSKWDLYQADLSKLNVDSPLDLDSNILRLNSKQEMIWMRRFKKVKSNPNFTWDIQVQFWTFRLGMKHLLPTMRILENQGFSDPRSVNTINKRPRWMGKERVHEKQSNMKITSTLVSKIYNFVDSYTIGGDRKIKLKKNCLQGTARRERSKIC